MSCEELLRTVSRPFSWCRRRKRKDFLTSLNRAQRIPLIDEGHTVVYLDPTEDDFSEMTDEIEWTNRALSVLSSDQSKSLDAATKAKLEGYIQTKLKTISQQNALDAINITTNRIAGDLEKQVSLDLHRNEIRNLLGKYKRVSSAVASSVAEEEEDDNDLLERGVAASQATLEGEERMMDDDEMRTVVATDAAVVVMSQPRQQQPARLMVCE